MDCIFCDIVAGKIPAQKIYEDGLVVAFLDIMPVNKGHALLIPKKHHENILEIPDDVLSALAKALKKISKAIKIATGADGFNVTMNNFKAAGQVVMHAHFHIIPRFDGDGLALWPSGKYDDDAEMAQFREKIIKEL